MAGHVGGSDLTEAQVADGVGIDGSVQVTKTSLTRKPAKVRGDDADNLVHILPTLKVSLVTSGEVGSSLVSDLLGSSLLVVGDDRVVADDEGGDEGKGGDGRDEGDGVRHGYSPRQRAYDM